MDLFVYKKNHVSACAKEWTLLLLNFISNEKNYFDSKHSMQVQRLLKRRCKKDFQACGCSLCLMKFGSIVNTLQNISCLCKKQIVLE